MTDIPLPLLPALPPPPDHSFASDNAAGVVPEVFEALQRANEGTALAYGDDSWTRRADAAFDELFGGYVRTLFCWGGTGANVVGLSSVLQSHEAIIAPASAHIVVDECGAPAKFSGASVLTVPTSDGRLRPDDLDAYIDWIGVEHHPQPAVVSISQATEMGTIYSPEEIGALCERAHAHSMLVHLDGARLANALVASGSSAQEMVTESGVDVVSFGMTKNGAMFGEAVVFLRPELAQRAPFVRKQAAQLASKNRFIAAQALALLEDDLWLRLASHANDAAARLAHAVQTVPEVELLREPEVNSLFVRVAPDMLDQLREWSFFWEWEPADSVVRWMTSWATTQEDIDRFARGVEIIAGGGSAA